LGQSICIDEINTFQFIFFSLMKNVGATDLGGLWVLEWECHVRVTNLCCVQSCNPNSLYFIVSEVSAFIFMIFWIFWSVCGR